MALRTDDGGGIAAGSDDRTTGSLSWVAQLQAYLQSTNSCNAQQRKALGDVVLENPNNPDAWLRFLENEEAVMGQSTGTRPSRGGVTLYHLYHKATELVQRTKGRPSESYVKIWLGYARQQW